jgi:hypothetical protein
MWMSIRCRFCEGQVLPFENIGVIRAGDLLWLPLGCYGAFNSAHDGVTVNTSHLHHADDASGTGGSMPAANRSQKVKPKPSPRPVRFAPVGLRIAERMGLTTGPKTRHINAKVSPKLFEAAAKRVGSSSPAVVINAALAALATEDSLGPYLASQWGVLADVDPEILELMDM